MRRKLMRGRPLEIIDPTVYIDGITMVNIITILQW